jgi:hypothetical protein
MLEITNKQKFPVQLVIRSRTAPRSFTVLNVPGIGCKKNIYLLEDERTTEYIDRAEKDGLISTRYIPNKLRKGE